MSTETAASTLDKITLERLNEEYIRALTRDDARWYEEHLADDFICIESDGSVLGKGEFLRRTSQGAGVTDYRLEDVQVRIFGATALVHATGRFTRKDGSSGMSRYTDVYVRTADNWKVVSAQITRIRQA